MNDIKLISIAELLDGRTFLIPSYQRGYRWTEKEVKDLLNDLYSFAVKKDKSEGEFYCLQPVIVQKVTKQHILEIIFEDTDTENKNVWEVIDGQQRLTSIYILYRYLLEKKGWDAERLLEDEEKVLYHLRYETRWESADFLEKLSMSTLQDDNVDTSHISDAYRVIDDWMKTEGKELSRMYNKKESLSSICDELFKLLNCERDKDETSGSAQFIWYEIESASEESAQQKAISEFLKINTGKIELTDAELIKALFLQKRNFESGEKEIKQLEIAMQWEGIENTLHKNDFWYFLSDITDKPNRIDALFELIYKADKVTSYQECSIDNSLNLLSEELGEKNTIFRYYYGLFEGKQGEDLQETIREQWSKIMSVFRTLEDWYEDPKTYNYVGFLSQCNVDIAKLFIKYSSLPETATKEDIEAFFIEQIKKQLAVIKVTDGQITTEYKDHKAIKKLLLFLNVNQMNTKLNNRMKANDEDFNGSIYKFPFDLFVSQDWNVEHIDSYTTNSLKRTEDIKEWVADAVKNIQSFDRFASKKSIIQQYFNDGKYVEIIPLIKEIGEEDADEDTKNSIGNLTLLDATTNKSYGNKLFFMKKAIIKERIRAGIFVPSTTEMVFNKDFEEGGSVNSISWNADDKVRYHNYILKELKSYLTCDEKDLQLF